MIDEAPTINRPRLVRNREVYLPPPRSYEIPARKPAYPGVVQVLIYIGCIGATWAGIVWLAVFLTSVGHG